MRIRSLPLLSALCALICACTVTTVNRRPVFFRPAPPPPPAPPPVVYEEPEPPPPVAYENRALYRYFGPHHIPDSVGGGWCYLDGVHDHDFAPEDPTWYRLDRGVYYYSAPISITFYDAHPDNHGGWCSLHGPHRHDYYPPRKVHTSFAYDRERHRYYYRAHEAVPAVRAEPEHHRGEPERRPNVEPDHPRGTEPSWRRAEPHTSAPPRIEAGAPRHAAEPAFSRGPPPHAAEPALPRGPPPHAAEPRLPPPRDQRPIGPPAFHPGPASHVGRPVEPPQPAGRLGPGPSAPIHPAGAPAGAGGHIGAAPNAHSIRPAEMPRPQPAASAKPDDKKRHPGRPR